GRLVERRQGRTTIRRLRLSYDDNQARPAALTVNGVAVKSYRRDGLLRPVEAIDYNTLLPSDGAPLLAGERPALASRSSFDALGRVVRETTVEVSGSSDVVIGELQRDFADDYAGARRLRTLRGEELSFAYSARGTLQGIVREGLASMAVELTNHGGLWVGARVAGSDESWSLTRTRDALGFVRTTGLGVTGEAAVSGDAVLRGPTGKITAELRFGPLLPGSLRGYSYDALGRLAEQSFQARSMPSLASFAANAPAALADEDAGAALLTTEPDPGQWTPV
ncbi:MAG: hypothetical protein IT383_15995, partial [Deltaproteobacteria bacterium]|nr:hypothetical protein [Deltaproteobacteria bacterium]